MGKIAKLPIPARRGGNVVTLRDVDAVAVAARSQLAVLSNPKELRNLADDLNKFHKTVAAIGMSREEINKIGLPLIEAQRKCGQALKKMAEDGSLAVGKGGDRKSINAASIDLKSLGFTWPRAARWQIAGQVPDAMFAEYVEKIKSDADAIYALSGVVKLGKLYLGRIQQQKSVKPTTARITRSSWQEWLPQQNDCDLLLTDPPYSTDVDDIAAFAAEWLPVALKKVKPTGRAYVCIGAYPHELKAYLNIETPPHLMCSQVLVWTYRNRVGPSPTHDYKLNWQAIIYYRGIDAPPLNCSRAVSEYPNLSEQFSVQDVSLPDPRRHESWHPWQKPDELCERFVRHASKPGDLVLDPFAGTGSFILAAARLGRNGLGGEVSPEMIKIAIKRGCKK